MANKYYDNPVNRSDPQPEQHTHNGKLVFGMDPLAVGADNYITLQNYRYNIFGQGIIGVSGNSKINTTAIPSYQKIRNGIQLRTNRTTGSRVLVHAEHSTDTDNNNSRVYENTSDIPDQGNFSATVVHTDSSPNLLGRFSQAPGEDIFYCNGEEMCQYAGDEMRVAGFFTAKPVTITTSDFVFSGSTATTSSDNFIERGFRSGQTVTIVNGDNDGNTRVISAISSDGSTLTFTVAPSAETLGSSQTIYVDKKRHYSDPIDYTEAVNNELQTKGNTVDTFGGNDVYTKLLVHSDSALTDSSSSGRVITANGNAAVSADAAKWGVGSLKLYGDGDSISVPDSADWDYADGELCIDVQVDFDSVDKLHTIYFQSDGAGDYDHVWLYYDGLRGKVYFQVVSSNGTVQIHEEASWSPSISTWYHFSVIRGWGEDSDDWAITVGGTAIHTFTAAVTLPDLSSAVYFGGGASGATLDYSGNDHPVKFSGTAQISSTYKFGAGGLLVDGNSDYVSLPDSDDWDIIGSNTGSKTVELWVKHTDHAGTEPYIYHYENSNNYWALQHIDGTGLRFICGSGGSTIITLSGGEITDTDWHHIALVLVGNGTTKDIGIYKDGVQVAYVQDDSTDTYGAEMRIGAGGGAYFDGSIDEVRIYDGNPFSATPNVGMTDTITIPTSEHTNDSNTKLLLHFDKSDFDGYLDEIRVSKGTPRWTEDFTEPDRKYKESHKRWYVFSTRPLKGAKFYVSNANTETSSLSGYYWTGRSFSELSVTDGTSSGGVSMAQTGSVTFGSTFDSAKPWHFEGLYLYSYLFELDEGGAEIYYVTLNAPFQKVVDVWDGVYRQAVNCQFYDESAGTYKDYTLEVNESSYSDAPIGLAIHGMTTSDHIILSFEERVAAINIAMLPGLVNTNPSSVTIYYWNGMNYTTVGEINDTTTHETGLKSFSQTGMISWAPPDRSDEAVKTEFGITGYFYKIEVSATISSATNVIVDVITGIPAQVEVPPFKFSSRFKNRILICNYSQGKEPNRVDYGVSNTTNVFNGIESSMSGIQSIYFGGNEQELTCGVQLYNRFGANIFATWIGIKEGETYLLTGDGPDDFQLYPISTSVGCPAPLTLDTAEMGYKLTDEAHRNIAMWLSYSGPVIFDGATIVPIPGMEIFFDESRDEYINKDLFYRSIGCYDPLRTEMNFIIPSGASATELNKWIIYNFSKRKIFEKVPNEYPQTLFDVMDTDGIRYIYGGIDTGYMTRIENGTTWADGTEITRVWETGDFVPGSVWEKKKISKMMFCNKKIDEDANEYITVFEDTISSKTFTRNDISFSGTTISTTNGNFLDTLKAGQIIAITGSLSNNVTRVIDSIEVDGRSFSVSSVEHALQDSAGNYVVDADGDRVMVVDELAELETETPGETVTITVVGDFINSLNEGDGRVKLNIKKTNFGGWSYRIKSTLTNGGNGLAEEGSVTPIFWGIEWQSVGPFDEL